jgi:voltage-gated potassium channel Kch
MFIVWGDFIVLYGMLGYGVRVLRVLATAGVLIVLFALIYYLTSAFYPQHGVILQADPGTTLSRNAFTGKLYDEEETVPSGAATGTSPARPLAGNPRAWQSGIAIQTALYFSTVTFTTLGYGDYRPEGRLQAVAAVEVSLGAVLIALLTVVFARRFLRL